MNVHGPLTRQKVDQLFAQASKLQDKYRQQIALLDELKHALVVQLIKDEGVLVPAKMGLAEKLVQGERVSLFDMERALRTMGLSK